MSANCLHPLSLPGKGMVPVTLFSVGSTYFINRCFFVSSGFSAGQQCFSDRSFCVRRDGKPREV